MTVVLSPTDALIYGPGGSSVENCTWAAGRAHPVATCVLTGADGKNTTELVPVNKVAVTVQPMENGAAAALVPWLTTAGAAAMVAFLAL